MDEWLEEQVTHGLTGDGVNRRVEVKMVGPRVSRRVNWRAER